MARIFPSVNLSEIDGWFGFHLVQSLSMSSETNKSIPKNRSILRIETDRFLQCNLLRQQIISILIARYYVPLSNKVLCIL